ncbi:cytochrome-b5 reductase [Starmerella bacillaris]|uniref:NADH-cytochrome b5 reductase n=1 Tax=Starmerella bacillaris TaxID=1247836 RepID=A0AAV5RML2_STABA|nr:cytochrome-b5 reductase [Starmerella bacillaris]
MSSTNLLIVTAFIALSTVYILKLTLNSKAKTNGGNSLSKEKSLHPVDFKGFKLVSKTPLNHNTSVYRFSLDHPEAILGLKIGQHVSVGATINGKEVVRSYTPISSDELKGHVDLLVKTYPNGNISKHISELDIGDHCYIRGPKGNFDYKPNQYKQINMIAGGSGITPMYQILRAVCENEDDKTKVKLVFANVNEDDIILRDSINELVAKKPDQVCVHYVLNNPPENWDGHTGFVTPELLAEILPPVCPNSKLLLCGPFPMTNAVKKAAYELGWEKSKAPSKMEDQVFVF